MNCKSHDAIVVPDERTKMDGARKRFADNLARLEQYNPELAIMRNRDWTDNQCTNDFIRHMAKKLWMHPFTDDEVFQVNKAVTGYLLLEKRRREAAPMIGGGRVIHGEIFSVKKTCDHTDCTRHYRMNVRDEQYKNTVYTPIPSKLFEDWAPEELIGSSVSFYAYITVSDRDNTFGFAHRPTLMNIQKEG